MRLNKADEIKTLNNEDYPLETEHEIRYVTTISCLCVYLDEMVLIDYSLDFFFGLRGGEEMDWGRKRKVGFREFLFAFMSWVGLDDSDGYMSS